MALTVQARKRLVTQTLVSQTELADDRLVEMAKGGDAEALDVLLKRYTPYARNKAKTYFLIGADREDIVQEGMIGLFKAIQDFDVTRAVSFRSFAELCITRQIITAIKAATRHKHTPLNSYVSIHKPYGGDEDDSERQLVDFLASARIVDPVEQVVAEDEVAQIRSFLAGILSDLEVEVLHLYLEGRSYQEIAASLRRQAKSIDNALQRIKRKLENFLDEREAEVEAAARKAALRTVPFDATIGGEIVFGLRQRLETPVEAKATNGNGHNGNGHNGNGHSGNGHLRAVAGASKTAKAVSSPSTTATPKRRSTARAGDLRASVRFAAKAAVRRSAKVTKALNDKKRSK